MFIHIPKTGGHSVWDVMEPRGGFRAKEEWGAKFTHHQSGGSLKVRLGPKFDTYKKFSLIRNPFERAVGLYFGRDNKTHRQSIAGFKKYMNNRRGLSKYRWNPYYSQLTFAGPHAKLFDLARIDELYDWMGHELGEVITERPYHKTGRHRHRERLPWREYYDDEIVGWMKEAQAADLERFGWEF